MSAFLHFFAIFLHFLTEIKRKLTEIHLFLTSFFGHGFTQIHTDGFWPRGTAWHWVSRPYGDCEPVACAGPAIVIIARALDTQPAKTNYQSQIGADLLTVFWFGRNYEG